MENIIPTVDGNDGSHLLFDDPGVAVAVDDVLLNEYGTDFTSDDVYDHFSRAADKNLFKTSFSSEVGKSGYDEVISDNLPQKISPLPPPICSHSDSKKSVQLHPSVSSFVPTESSLEQSLSNPESVMTSPYDGHDKKLEDISGAEHWTKTGKASVISELTLAISAEFCLKNGLNLLYGFIHLSSIIFIRILVFLKEISTSLPMGFGMVCIIAILQFVDGEIDNYQSTVYNHTVDIQWNLTKQIVQLWIGDYLAFVVPEKVFSMYFKNDSTVQEKLVFRRKEKDKIIFSDEVLKPPVLSCQTNENSTTIILKNASSLMQGEYCFFSPQFCEDPRPCVNVTLLDNVRKNITDQDGKDIDAWIIPVVVVITTLAIVAVITAIACWYKKCRASTNPGQNDEEEVSCVEDNSTNHKHSSVDKQNEQAATEEEQLFSSTED